MNSQIRRAIRIVRSGPPPPPPPDPELDAIRWIEDRDHGPWRPRTWRCWLGHCPHREPSC